MYKSGPFNMYNHLVHASSQVAAGAKPPPTSLPGRGSQVSSLTRFRTKAAEWAHGS